MQLRAKKISSREEKGREVGHTFLIYGKTREGGEGRKDACVRTITREEVKFHVINFTQIPFLKGKLKYFFKKAKLRFLKKTNIKYKIIYCYETFQFPSLARRKKRKKS